MVQLLERMNQRLKNIEHHAQQSQISLVYITPKIDELFTREEEE